MATSRKKRILLFSDGTGNSSGKLNKTNVWRMYEAVDFGVPEDENQVIQIGRYDDGIGTTALRPMALIQGIFGFGLAKNVRALYLFLCQNYEIGNEVCLFGFSRGAFTVRVLADLIDKQGIISAENGEDLPFLVQEAYRRYRREAAPPIPPMRWIVKGSKEASIAVHRLLSKGRAFETVSRHEGVVSFLGVWDTVDAYGGPIVELVRGIDLWIARISFESRTLPKCVVAARHALALDEERDAFQPIPWDEAHGTPRSKLLQVWFAGAHSDVGGGYPEQGLAHVSLCWMMEHVLAHGIRLKPDQVRRAIDARDASGRMHDPRSGMGAFYRYQPRNVGAYILPPEVGTETQTDPKQPADEGMRTPVLIHESVFQRMAFGTDRYAPVSIGGRYEIVSDRLTTMDGNLVSRLGRSSALPPEVRTRLQDNEHQAAYLAARPRVLDRVWLRRIAYFSLAAAAMVLLFMPVWQSWFLPEQQGGLFHVIAMPFKLLDTATPSLVSPWTGTIARRPIASIAAIGVIVSMYAWGLSLESKLRADMRAVWKSIINGSLIEAAPDTRIRGIRTSKAYQGWFTVLKWYALPSFFGVSMVAMLLVTFFGLLVQARLSPPSAPDLACARVQLNGGVDGRRGCSTLPVTVEAARAYTLMLAFQKPAGWPNGKQIRATAWSPSGRAAYAALDGAAVGIRRMVDAGWLQPLVYVKQVKPFRARIQSEWQPDQVLPLRMTYAGNSVDRVFYVGTFHTAYSGRLGLGFNDAVTPWPLPATALFRSRWLHGSDSYATLFKGSAQVGLWVSNGGPMPQRLMSSPSIDAWLAGRAYPNCVAGAVCGE